MKRLLIIGLALLAGGLLLLRQNHQTAEARSQLAGVRLRCLELSNQLATAELRTVDLRKDLDLATQERSLAVAELARAGRVEPSAPLDPATRWNSPPESLPEWNPESPFVWLDKSLLPKFQVPAFQSDGRLAPGVSEVLALDRPTQESLDRALSSVVSEYRREELAHARLVDDHLPQIAKQEGRKLTLRVDPMPDVTTRLRRAFEETLERHLGTQRAQILTRSAIGWISEMFPSTQDNPRVISIALDSRGDHHIAMQNGIGTMSASGPGDFITYIPLHLRPLVEEFHASVRASKTR